MKLVSNDKIQTRIYQKKIAKHQKDETKIIASSDPIKRWKWISYKDLLQVDFFNMKFTKEKI